MYNLVLFCFDGRYLPLIMPDSALPEVLHVICYYSKPYIWFNNAWGVSRVNINYICDKFIIELQTFLLDRLNAKLNTTSK